MEIIPTSATGQALQAAIQKQLAFHGWSSEDDTVMAEYCLVMLGNRKTSDQISTELSDLIGADFDPTFVTWLFTELNTHYPPPATSSAPILASNNNMNIDSRSHNNPRRNGPSMFNAAMSGMKRDNRGFDEGNNNGQNQRARYERPEGFDGIPAGPRSNVTTNGQVNGRNDERLSRNGGGRSLADRVGPHVRNNGYAQGFDPVQSTIDAVTAGQLGQGYNMNPQQQAMAQAQAVAMAQAFAAMQQSGGQGWNPGFNPQQGFNPNFNNGYPGPSRQQQRQQPFQPFQPFQPPHSKTPSAPIPNKPVSEQICKHGVSCSKATCPFSHPSPVATKDSGLVLSSEPCEKQLLCTDIDCPKSHVSVAQKNPSAIPAPYKTPSFKPPSSDPSAIPGAGERPCKFAGACTRAGCVFVHPWDTRSEAGAVPCHWAEKCTRADCHFSHPPSRPSPFAAPKSSTPYKKPNAYSATFNAAGTPSTTWQKPDTIGAWPKEEKSHISNRLQRFSNGDGESGGERIIPGEVVVEMETEDVISSSEVKTEMEI